MKSFARVASVLAGFVLAVFVSANAFWHHESPYYSVPNTLSVIFKHFGWLAADFLWLPGWLPVYLFSSREYDPHDGLYVTILSAIYWTATATFVSYSIERMRVRAWRGLNRNDRANATVSLIFAAVIAISAVSAGGGTGFILTIATALIVWLILLLSIPVGSFFFLRRLLMLNRPRRINQR